jgi:transposase-like protein
MYLYRAIDNHGDTVESWFSERRNLAAAKRFLRKALKRHGRPQRIVIDGSQTNREAIASCGMWHDRPAAMPNTAEAEADPHPPKCLPE